MSVRFDAAFVPRLEAIANEGAQFCRFTKMENSHEFQPTVNVPRLITGIVLVVLAMTVLQQTKSTKAIFLFGAVCVLSALYPTSVPTAAYVAKIQEINDFFNPVIDGITRAYEAKKITVKEAVTGYEVVHMADACGIIKSVASQFDLKKTFNGKPLNSLIDTAEGENIRLRVVAAAWKLCELGEVTSRLDPVAITAMRRLKMVALQFIYGDSLVEIRSDYSNATFSDEPGKDAYVCYNVINKKIVVI